MTRLRSLILMAILLVASAYSKAQLLLENFETNALPSGWNNSYQQADGKPWQFQNGKALVANTAGVLGAESGPSWLISPSFKPKPGQGTLVIELGFSSGPVGSSHFNIMITSKGSTEYMNYESLLSVDRNITSSAGSNEIRVRIPQKYWGEPCYLAFVQSVSGLLSTDQVSIDELRLESDSWFSVGSGLSSGVIWSESKTGNLSTANFNANSSLVIQEGNQVVLDSDLELVNITINPQASLNLNGHSLIVRGDLVSKGEVLGKGSDIRFNGDYRQYIDGNILFGDITEDNAAGVEVLGGNVRLAGELSFVQGTFYTNGNLTVFSDQQGTGSIGDITGGGIEGYVTIQRYVPAGQTDWRFLSSPLINKTLNDINDDMVTSGFPGSDKPGFSFITAYSYQESKPGGVEAGFVPATDITNPFVPGSGYYIYCGDSAQASGAFVLDMTGAVNQGNVYIPVSYTQTTNIEANGYNLVGNPYPSPINFNSLEKGNLENRYWIYDPVSGNMDMWNESAQTGLIKTDGNISSMQGFMVRATGSNAYIFAQEKDKVSKAEPVFLKAPDNRSYLTLKLKSTTSKFYDVVVTGLVDQSTDGYDQYDSEKINISNPDAPKIAAVVTGSHLGINSIPNAEPGDTIQLLIRARKNGVYKLTLEESRGFDEYYVILLNKLSGERKMVDEQLALELTLTRNSDVTDFVLIFEKRESFSFNNERCYGDGSGFLAATGPGNGPWTYTWKNTAEEIIREVNSSVVDVLVSPVEGEYTVEIRCADYDVKTYSFSVVKAKEIQAVLSVQDESCPEKNDGLILLTATGGTGKLKFRWSNGSEQQNLQQLDAGTYSVTITDSLGCIKTASIAVNQPDTMRVQINVADTVYRGDTVYFESVSNKPVNDFKWNFGDGFTSVDERPGHVFMNVGTFTIQLETRSAFCTATNSKFLVVREKAGSGIVDNETINNCLIQITGNRLSIMPDRDYDQLRIISMEGKILYIADNLKAKELKEVIMDTCSSGIYVVTLMVGEKALMRKVQFN